LKALTGFLLVLIELFFASCYGWGATSEYQLQNYQTSALRFNGTG